MAYKNTVKDYSQMIGYITRDKTTDVPGSMAHELRNMAIGPRGMVGEITEEQTQFGRPIYQTPAGEKVSEKSTTLFFNGNWMNVPSIHGGKSFNEDELRLMIKQGNIEPTSVHKSKADAEAAAKARSASMADGGVIGKPGGVVEPGVMYYGRPVDRKAKWKTTAGVAPEKQIFMDKILKKLIDSGKTSFEKFSEVTDLVKDKMGRTTAMSAIEQSPYASKISFTGAGSGLDTEILESDWFKKNYPNAKTIKEASGDQPLSKVRNQYKLAKSRGFSILQKEMADLLGVPQGTLRDYISYARTSKKPTNPNDISRVKRAKEFVKLLEDSGITFTGGGQRYGGSDIRFTATPEQIANFKKTYEKDFLKGFTKEQYKKLNDAVRTTFDEMVKSGNLMTKANFADLLKTKVGFGSINAMTRAADRVLSENELKQFKPQPVDVSMRGMKRKKSIQMAGEDANKIRVSQDRYLDSMRDTFKSMSDKELKNFIAKNPKLLNQVTLRFKDGEFFNEKLNDLSISEIRNRSKPHIEHIKKFKEAGQNVEFPYNRQIAVSNINKHIKESVEGFINRNEPKLKRKDIPLEVKEKIKNQILNIEKKMNDMSLRMFANNKYRGVPEGLPAIDRQTGQLTSFYKNVESMGLNPKTFAAKIPSKFKPLAIAAGLTGGMITAAAAGTESPEQASNLLDKAKSILPEAAAGTAAVGGAYAARKPIMAGLGKAFRILGTRPAGVGFAGLTIADNLKKGENLADAIVDPLVGAELLLPNLFKENVSKITSNPTLQKLLKFGKYGRMFTPIGAGITAAGLGVDAYKRAQELQAMSPEERAELAQKRDEFSFGEYSGAAEGGIASLNVNKK